MIKIEASRQIGAVVRNERTRQGLTQQQLAESADVSRALISRLEKGTATALYPEKLLAILGAIGLSLFIDESPANEPPSDKATRSPLSHTLSDAVNAVMKERNDALSSSALTDATRAALSLGEQAELGALLSKKLQPSFAEMAEQLAAITANGNFLETSPLLAPRKPHHEGEDDE